ncbi:MAG: hypothetical protein ABS939_17685 [Psychrobacillus sp.]|uniref:hypothetical protein n=1 Tax=uncultured Psychrobacillus sp. TaxID=1551585 RepID=UPI0026381777|nr:hypothetical protein [uncultured Psychrobacillus sp.]
MAPILLAEAVKLKSILLKRVQELEIEMMRVGFTVIEKGTTPAPPIRTVSAIDLEMNDIRSDIRKLDRLIYEANLNNTVTYKEADLTIVEAIELATQLRAQARVYKQLGSHEKQRIQFSGYGEGTTYVEVALYEPEEYRKKALDFEKDANKLSGLINAKNYAVTIAFDDEKYA